MNMLVSHSSISARGQSLEASKIREIAEYGMKLDGVLPLWFGEGAWPTGSVFVDAAIKSLKNGNHLYQPNNGSMALREEIANYTNRLLNTDIKANRITVTPSGMQGLMLTAQLLVSEGDRVVSIEPSWPNIAGAYKAMGADLFSVPLSSDSGRWTLDMDRMMAALTPDTKVVIINSPNNPTGWTMSAEDQAIVLEHCRKHGIWIVADDVYSRLYRHANNAPSFLSLIDSEDRVISVNSFSKCWSMTGWRLGWITAPAELENKFGQLTEFNTSCTAGFIQDAGIVALREGEFEVESLKRKIHEGYLLSAQKLSSFPRVRFIEPDGAFYCFFKVDGLKDSFDAAKVILQETGVGLAPGIAFGGVGEGYLRLCYAQPKDVLEEAFSRLELFLSK